MRYSNCSENKKQTKPEKQKQENSIYLSISVSLESDTHSLSLCQTCTAAFFGKKFTFLGNRFFNQNLNKKKLKLKISKLQAINRTEPDWTHKKIKKLN